MIVEPEFATRADVRVEDFNFVYDSRCMTIDTGLSSLGAYIGSTTFDMRARIDML